MTVISVFCPPLLVSTTKEYSIEVLALWPPDLLTALVIVERIVVRAVDDEGKVDIELDEVVLRELIEL